MANISIRKFIPVYYTWLSWRRLGNDAVKHANHCVRSTTKVPGTVVCFTLFGRSPWLVVELDHLCGVERTLTPHKGNDRITQCDSIYMVRHPRGSYIAYPLLRLEMATPENK